MLRAIEKYTAPIWRRVLQTVARAVIKNSLDTGGVQKLQLLVLADELLDGVDRVQEYGFTSRPMTGAEAVMVCVGGNRDHPVVIAVDDRRYRIKALEEGEVAIYDDQDQKIVLKRGNKIEVTTPGEVEVNAQTVDVNCTTATLDATEAMVTAPQTTVVAATQVTMTTPLLAVSGLIACSGIAAGGASPSAGKVVVNGSVEATGDVEDSSGSMAEMRGQYNSHTHGGGGLGPDPQMT